MKTKKESRNKYKLELLQYWLKNYSTWLTIATVKTGYNMLNCTKREKYGILWRERASLTRYWVQCKMHSLFEKCSQGGLWNFFCDPMQNWLSLNFLLLSLDAHKEVVKPLFLLYPLMKYNSVCKAIFENFLIFSSWYSQGDL